MRGRSIGETLENGKYRIVDFLVGPAYRALYAACLVERPDELYLASVVFAPRGVPVDKLNETLDYSYPGIFDLCLIGQFDQRGEDAERNAWQRQDWVMLERIPRGTWLPRLLSAPLSPTAAIQLGISLGEIMLSVPAEKLSIFYGLRPECIWAERRGAAVVATGLSARYNSFFLHQSRNVTDLIFRRNYGAPDWTREPSALPQLMSYMLATMIAEWTRGGVVFPDDCSNHDDAPILRGDALLSPAIPSGLADVLRGAFLKQSQRMPLEELVAALKKLAA